MMRVGIRIADPIHSKCLVLLEMSFGESWSSILVQVRYSGQLDKWKMG